MSTRLKDMIVIGRSAGSMEPLQQLVSELAPQFPGRVFVVLHFPKTNVSRLPEILSCQGRFRPAIHQTAH